MDVFVEQRGMICVLTKSATALCVLHRSVTVISTTLSCVAKIAILCVVGIKQFCMCCRNKSCCNGCVVCISCVPQRSAITLGVL